MREWHGCHADVCEASQLDGIICANDECDIRAGLREAPIDHPLRRAMVEIEFRQRFGSLHDEIFGT